MTSYGGYARTGYGTQGGEDGGGFMSASQQGSQGGERKSNRDDALRPVTIKQLVDCKESYKDAELSIDGAPVTHVTLVGQVRSVTPATINNTYRLDDGTGIVEIKQWIDAENPDKAPRFAPDTYLRVFGHLRTFNGKLSVNASRMRPIEDFNEVNYHLLEATYVHLSLTKGAAAGGGQQQGGDGDGMFVDGGYGAGDARAVQARLAPCSRNAQAIFKFLLNAAGEGQHISQVSSFTGLSNKDIMSAAEELLNEGLVFTTEDDETWAILEI